MQQTTHIRVIADDDTRARDEMISLMHTDEDISVVGAGADAEQAIAIAKREHPDVAALDERMPGGGGVRAAREITRVSPRTELIAISADDDPHDGARSLGNRERRRRLEAMVRGEGIEVVYQPIFDLESGSAVGAEALCRFEVSPLRSSDVWFREAVEQGLGNELEVTAVRHALRGLEQLDPSISLHVNVSPEACCSPKLRGLLEHVPGDRIVLEITENAPVEDYERLEAALTPLRNRGVGLAVDDPALVSRASVTRSISGPTRSSWTSRSREGSRRTEPVSPSSRRSSASLRASKRLCWPRASRTTSNSQP